MSERRKAKRRKYQAHQVRCIHCRIKRLFLHTTNCQKSPYGAHYFGKVPRLQ